MASVHLLEQPGVRAGADLGNDGPLARKSHLFGIEERPFRLIRQGIRPSIPKLSTRGCVLALVQHETETRTELHVHRRGSIATADQFGKGAARNGEQRRKGIVIPREGAPRFVAARAGERPRGRKAHVLENGLAQTRFVVPTAGRTIRRRGLRGEKRGLARELLARLVRRAVASGEGQEGQTKNEATDEATRQAAQPGLGDNGASPTGLRRRMKMTRLAGLNGLKGFH